MSESIKRHCLTVIKSLDLERSFIESEISRFKKFIDYIDKKYDLVPANTIEPVDYISLFINERIRVPITDEEKLECRTDPVTMSRVRMTFNQWKKTYSLSLSGIAFDQVWNRLTSKYGETNDKREWSSFKIFNSEESAKEWDEAHK